MSISCLINVYKNDSPFHFKEAMDSIVNQSLKASEIIIIIDGEVSNELLKSINLYKKLENVKIHHMPVNMGLNAARKIGIGLCKYEYIALMDADDISDLTRFEKQIAAFNKNPDYDYIGGQIQEFNEISGRKSLRIVPLKHKDIVNFAKFRFPMNNVTSMYKRETYCKTAGYDDERGYEDYKLFYKFLEVGAKFLNIEDVLVYVRTDKYRLERHSGISYFINEKNFFWNIYKKGFINYNEYLLNILIRLFTRFLPRKILALVYYLLRS